MKRLVKNIALMLLLLLFINSILHSYVLPFAWGDNVLYVKYENYKKNKDEFNTIYLGGSLEYRHINPQIVDSLCSMNGLEISSYNLGVDGNGFLKQKWELEEILKDPSPNLKYVFVSLSNSSIFLRLNLHTQKFATWWRVKDIAYAIRLTWDLPMSFKRKVKFTYFYLLTLVENRLNFGHLTEAVQFFVKPVGYDESYLGVHRDGFYPYDLQETRQLMSQAWEDSLMKQSRVVYLEDSAARRKMLERNIREFSDTSGSAPLLRIMLETYKDMIGQCAEKGIKMIVLMPPRTREPYTWFIPIYEGLPDENKISLASPLEYPEFYDVKNSYNFHHLNHIGARLYSFALADKFLELEGIAADLYPIPQAASPDQILSGE